MKDRKMSERDYRNTYNQLTVLIRNTNFAIFAKITLLINPKQVVVLFKKNVSYWVVISWNNLTIHYKAEEANLRGKISRVHLGKQVIIKY